MAPAAARPKNEITINRLRMLSSAAAQQPDGDPICVDPVRLVVPLAMVEPSEPTIVVERPPPQAFVKIGHVTIGRTPPLSSSVAPSGMAPPGIVPVLIPPIDDVDAVPDAVPADVAVLQESAVLVFMPAPSNVELEPAALELKQGSVVAAGSSGVGLSPPGESQFEPGGIQTGPQGGESR